MASANTLSANEQAKDLIIVQRAQLKPITKAQISGRMDISDVAFTSEYSEKTRLKKLMMIIMNKSQERRFLAGARILFHYETEARKVMVDFKFDALCR